MQCSDYGIILHYCWKRYFYNYIFPLIFSKIQCLQDCYGSTKRQTDTTKVLTVQNKYKIKFKAIYIFRQFSQSTLLLQRNHYIYNSLVPDNQKLRYNHMSLYHLFRRAMRFNVECSTFVYICWCSLEVISRARLNL